MKTGLVIILIMHIYSQPAFSQGIQRSAIGKNGMVVSVEKYATQIGADILRKGGHAVDAAVAVAFALAVTYPQAGNIGGGGFMIIRLANGKSVAIDYRETAPANATTEMYLRKDGTIDTELSDYGYLAAGVPGTVRGLESAWKKYGRLPWKTLIEPAITLAEQGFNLTDFHAQQFRFFENDLKKFPSTAKIFFKKDGTSYQAGDRWIQKDLATTLRLIAEQGADAFYKGAIADRIVADMRRNGGIITHNDLSNYHAVIRKPVIQTYRGYEMIGMPPPSSGGLTLSLMLNLLECAAPVTEPNVRDWHYLIEIMRLAYFDRARYIGDPDFVDVPADTFLSKSYAARLFASIDPSRARPSLSLSKELMTFRENLETTHFSIIDKEGNAVANTYTLEDNFGSKAVIEGAGFLINNEMHDFNIQPRVGNYKGWEGFNPNLIQPGKRMLSSMTPTIIVKDGKPFLITGSPGGRTIINTVLQVITGVIDRQFTLREAIDQPRLNHNWLPDVVLFEKHRWSAAVIDSLKTYGHRFRAVPFIGDAHSIFIDPKTGWYYGEADTRRMGWAEGY